MRRVSIPLWVLVLSASIGSALVGATIAQSYNGPSPSNARKTAVENRADVFNRAVSLIPDPGKEMSNFPIRRAIKEMTLREDKVNHPWYIYTRGVNGNVIGYYVAKYPPVNACDFLSSTEDVYNSDHGNLKMQSPSYDGVYYGQSACDVWVIFDAATNAEIKIRGEYFDLADQPLRIVASPITVKHQ
jgi:hypothetical protein